MHDLQLSRGIGVRVPISERYSLYGPDTFLLCIPMDASGLVRSFTREDLKAILRCDNDDSSGTTDELRRRVQEKFEKLPWRNLLVCVPKESLQQICREHGLESDLSKDELIDRIARSRSRVSAKDNPLRRLFGGLSR